MFDDRFTVRVTNETHRLEIAVPTLGINQSEGGHSDSAKPVSDDLMTSLWYQPVSARLHARRG